MNGTTFGYSWWADGRANKTKYPMDHDNGIYDRWLRMVKEGVANQAQVGSNLRPKIKGSTVTWLANNNSGSPIGFEILESCISTTEQLIIAHNWGKEGE